MFCNEDTGARGFDALWAAYQKRLAANLVTGVTTFFTAGCTGWMPPTKPVQLRRNSSSVVLVGHLFETMSPYEWTWQTWIAVGGTVLTVNDDIHGSALMVDDCSAKMVDYSASGRTPAASAKEWISLLHG